MNPFVLMVQFADQALREILISHPEFELEEVDQAPMPSGPVVWLPFKAPER